MLSCLEAVQLGELEWYGNVCNEQATFELANILDGAWGKESPGQPDKFSSASEPTWRPRIQGECIGSRQAGNSMGRKAVQEVKK